MNLLVLICCVWGIVGAQLLAMDQPATELKVATKEAVLDREIYKLTRLVPVKLATQLFEDYTEHDAGFKKVYDTVVDNLVVLAVFKNMPEFRDFEKWQNTWGAENATELLGPLQVQDYNFSGNETFTRTSANPRLSGINGFIKELIVIIPKTEILEFVNMKLAAGGTFAEYWTKIITLKPAYERVLASPQFKTLLNSFVLLGGDFTLIDGYIRSYLGW